MKAVLKDLCQAVTALHRYGYLNITLPTGPIFDYGVQEFISVRIHLVPGPSKPILQARLSRRLLDKYGGTVIQETNEQQIIGSNAAILTNKYTTKFIVHHTSVTILIFNVQRHSTVNKKITRILGPHLLNTLVEDEVKGNAKLV